MPSGKKDYAAGEWSKTPTGRLYRYIDIEGNQYCQWDHAKGPVLPVDNSTPRTIDPRNSAGTQPSSAQQSGPQSTSETRPIPARHDSLSASGANALQYGQTRASGLPPYGSSTYGSFPQENHQPIYSILPREDRQTPSTSYSPASINQQYASAPLPGLPPYGSSTYGSFPQENHEPIYSIFPREDRQTPSTSYSPASVKQQPYLPASIKQQHASATLPAREVKAHDGPDRSLSNPPKIPTKPDQPKYPAGTRKVIKKPDRTYYLDGDGKVISTVAVTRQDSRQETRAEHRQPTTDLITQFASMGAQGWGSEGDEQSRTARYSSDQVRSAQAPTEDHRASSRPRSDPRESSQLAGRDAKTVSTRPDLERHHSQGSSFGAQDERSQSRERPVETQRQEADDDNQESSTQPGQGPPRDSLAQKLSYKGSSQHTQGQTNSAMPGHGPVPQPQPTNNVRRLSVNQGAGLPTISESGLLKATVIAGDNKGRSEIMDDRYYVRKDAKNFFVMGRVFAMLWHENAGNEGTDLSEGRYYNGKYGQKIYSTIRRMVVVKQKHGHCTCVPIATYGKQGTLKSGLSEADIRAHAVIYMVGTSSAAAPGERIVKNPIAVKPAKEDQKLHSMSRINFDKIYTIEHNVKVMNVGKVADDSLHNLSLYYYNTHFGT